MLSNKWILKVSRFSIMWIVIVVCAGNIVNSVLLKRGFEGSYGFTFNQMMDGDVTKPIVYRSLGAKLCKKITQLIPSQYQNKLYSKISHKHKRGKLYRNYFSYIPKKQWTPANAIAFHCMFLIVSICVILSLLTIFNLAKMHEYTFGQSLIFMISFSIIYPLTFQAGSYYYDFIELLGVFSTVYFFLKRKFWISTLLIFIFSFNKETFFLVSLGLYFLHDKEISLRKKLFWLTLQFILSFAARIYIMSGYTENLGDFVEFNLMENLLFWIHPKTYLLGFQNLVAPGFITPSIENVLFLIPIYKFFKFSWKKTSHRYKQYFLSTFFPLFILFIFFGNMDEIRVFCLSYPAITLIALSGARQFNFIFSEKNLESTN